MRAILKLRSADPVVRIDMMLRNGPTFLLNKFPGVFDLGGSRFILFKLVVLVGGFSSIYGASPPKEI